MKRGGQAALGLIGLALAVALLLPATSYAGEWQTYLADDFGGPESMFYTGQAGEALYAIDEQGRYVIDGLNTGSDSLSSLTDSLYYYYLEAQCELLQTNAGELAFTGLVFHYNKSIPGKLSYYVFYIYGDGYYGAKRVVGDQVDIIIPLTPTDMLDLYGVNVLAVDAQGTSFDVYINGRFIDGFTDVRVDGGGFGFYVSKHARAAFDNFAVKVERRAGGREDTVVPPGTGSNVADEGGAAADSAEFERYQFPVIPKDPNRPTYSWEVGVDKTRKGKPQPPPAVEPEPPAEQLLPPVELEPEPAEEPVGGLAVPDQPAESVPAVVEEQQPPASEPVDAVAVSPGEEVWESVPVGDASLREVDLPPDEELIDQWPEAPPETDVVIEDHPVDSGAPPALPPAAPTNGGEASEVLPVAPDAAPEPVRRMPQLAIPAVEPPELPEELHPATGMHGAGDAPAPAEPEPAPAEETEETPVAAELPPEPAEEPETAAAEPPALEVIPEAELPEPEPAAAESPPVVEPPTFEPEEPAAAPPPDPGGELAVLTATPEVEAEIDEPVVADHETPLAELPLFPEEEPAAVEPEPSVEPVPAIETEPGVESEAEAEAVAEPAVPETPAEVEPLPAPVPESPDEEPAAPAVVEEEEAAPVDEAPAEEPAAPVVEEEETAVPEGEAPAERAEPLLTIPEPEPVEDEAAHIEAEPEPIEAEAEPVEAGPESVAAEPEPTEAEPSWREVTAAMRDHSEWGEDDEVVAAYVPPEPEVADEAPAEAEPESAPPADAESAPEAASAAQPGLSLYPPEEAPDEDGATELVPLASEQDGELSYGSVQPGLQDLAVGDAQPAADEGTSLADVAAESAAPVLPPPPAAPQEFYSGANLEVGSDDFSEQHWPVSDAGDATFRYFGAAYEILNLDAETMAISYQDAVLGDCELAVDAEYLEGLGYVGYGLATRLNVVSGAASYYGLFVCQTGEFMLLKVRRGTEEVLMDWTPAAGLKPNQPNRIALDARGSVLTAYINGELVATVQDSEISAGGYALLAGPGVAVRFDDLSLRGFPR